MVLSCQSHLGTEIFGQNGWGHCKCVDIWDIKSLEQRLSLSWFLLAHTPHAWLTGILPSGSRPCRSPYKWPNGPQLAWCWTGPGSPTEWKLWTLALILALLKHQLDFFHGWTRGIRTLEIEGFNSMQIKIAHSPMQVSENPFSMDISRTPPQQQTGEMKYFFSSSSNAT